MTALFFVVLNVFNVQFIRQQLCHYNGFCTKSVMMLLGCGLLKSSAVYLGENMSEKGKHNILV